MSFLDKLDKEARPSGKARGENNPGKEDTFRTVMNDDRGSGDRIRSVEPQPRLQPASSLAMSPLPAAAAAHNGRGDTNDNIFHDDRDSGAQNGKGIPKSRQSGSSFATPAAASAHTPRGSSGGGGECRGRGGRLKSSGRRGSRRKAESKTGGEVHGLLHAEPDPRGPFDYNAKGARGRRCSGDGSRRGRARTRGGSGSGCGGGSFDKGSVRKTEGMVLFWKEPACFVQWTPCTFEVDGVTYCNAEQWMMAKKAELFGDSKMHRQIMATTDPGRQKALGRRVRGFDPAVWDTVGYEVVVRGNLEKFRQNSHFRDELLATGDRILAEASPYDCEWGIGLHAGDDDALVQSKWPGKNKLGEALMDVRSKLRSEANVEVAGEEEEEEEEGYGGVGPSGGGGGSGRAGRAERSGQRSAVDWTAVDADDC